MCADDTTPDPTPETDEGASVTLDSQQSGSILSWPRRKFLAAAALGTAAATLLGGEGGLTFGPLAAFAATNFATASCTANDQNVGVGTVVTPSCTPCTGAFNPVVSFPVQNGTGTNRYCVALHLFSQTVGGVTIPEQDVLLENSQACATNPSGSGCTSNSAPKATTTMYGVVTGFPCNVEQVSFPNAVVYWQTSTGQASCTAPNTKFPSGQCERQTITINSFGVSLACTAGCPATCGGSITLTATGAASAAQAPYTYSLFQGTDITGTALQTSAPTSALTFTFNAVTPPSGTTTYTVKFADTNGCYRTAPFTITVSPISVSLSGKADSCSGSVAFTATPTPASPPSGSYAYVWKVDNTTQSATGNTFTYAPPLDCATHTVAVTVSNSDQCSASDSKTVTQSFNTTIA